jgi:hypothetical protein
MAAGPLVEAMSNGLLRLESPVPMGAARPLAASGAASLPSPSRGLKTTTLRGATLPATPAGDALGKLDELLPPLCVGTGASGSARGQNDTAQP